MKPTVYIENIENSESNVPLFHKYPNELQPQNAYTEIDLHTGRVMADWDGEVGGGVPCSVVDGEVLRIDIPPQVSKRALLDKLSDEEFLDKVETILDAYENDDEEEIETMMYNFMADVQNMVFFDVDDLMGVYQDPYEYIGETVLPYSDLTGWTKEISVENYAEYLMDNVPDNTEVRGDVNDWYYDLCRLVVEQYVEENNFTNLEPHHIYKTYEYLDIEDPDMAEHLREMVEGGKLYGDDAIDYAEKYELPLYYKDNVVSKDNAVDMDTPEWYDLHVKIGDMRK
jgi:hypothetical protein